MKNLPDLKKEDYQKEESKDYLMFWGRYLGNHFSLIFDKKARCWADNFHEMPSVGYLDSLKRELSELENLSIKGGFDDVVFEKM
jgi:hypothetical protein